MISLFSKKRYKNINDYPSVWTGATAKNPRSEELLHLLRINTGLKDSIGHPDYSVRMDVAVPVDNLDPGDEIFYRLEEEIDTYLSRNNTGIRCFSITGLSGMQFREFVSYTKEGLDFAAFHEKLRQLFPQLDVQMYANKDPKWKVYSSYMRSLKP